MASHRCHCDTAFKEKSRRRQKSLGAVRRVENRCRSWPAQRREGLAKGGVSRSETSAFVKKRIVTADIVQSQPGLGAEVRAEGEGGR